MPDVPEDVNARIWLRISDFFASPETAVLYTFICAEWHEGYKRGFRAGHVAVQLPPSTLDDDDICGVCL